MGLGKSHNVDFGSVWAGSVFGPIELYYATKGMRSGGRGRKREKRVGRKFVVSCFVLIQCTCTRQPDHTCGPEGFFASEYAIDRNLYERLKFTERS